MTTAFAQGYLSVSKQHQIYYAQFGDVSKPAALFLHGGPGSGCNPAQAKLFPLEHCHLVQFDQRGCGKSLPLGELHENTTQHLVQDIETLRKHLGITHWHVIYGGSWGATLALEYAKVYPQYAQQIVLRGSFLARAQDLDWFIQPNGLAQQLPQAYQTLLNALAPPKDTNLLKHLFHQLQKPTQQAYPFVYAWNQWECAAMNIPAPPFQASKEQQEKQIKQLKVYLHYCLSRFFLEHGIFQKLERLSNTPITATHGKDDQVCPLFLAYDLHKALPHLNWVNVNAGHGIFEEALANSISQSLTNCFLH